MRLFFVAGLAFALTGCATVTRGTDNDIELRSNPPGATAITTLGHSCITPCQVKVSRRDEFTVTFNLEGYEPGSVAVETYVPPQGAAGMAGNLLIGGIVGAGVDAATGAARDHRPNPVFHDFTQQSPVGADPAPDEVPSSAADTLTS